MMMFNIDPDEYKDWTLKERLVYCASIFVAMLCALCICVLTSCSTTKYIPQTITKHDTLRVVNMQRDSILFHDSVYVEKWMQGDTTFLTKYVEHTAYRDRWRTDTVYKAVTDSVQTVREVEKRLSWWQRTRLTLGNIFLTLLSLGIAYLICWLCHRFVK